MKTEQAVILAANAVVIASAGILFGVAAFQGAGLGFLFSALLLARRSSRS